MEFLDKIKEITDAIVKIDQKVGFRHILLYIVLILVLIGIFNFKSIVRGSIELVQELNEEIHTEKMEMRDQLLHELTPILLEFRSAANADRVLYFEYHNSKENLVGIPFKYVDLVLQNTRYGIAAAPESLFKDINVGIITNLYESIKTNNVICCNGPQDNVFEELYPGTFDLFSSKDGSQIQVFISIPGIKQPVGMIVLEWQSVDEEFDINKVESIVNGTNSFVSRINALIMSKS